MILSSRVTLRAAPSIPLKLSWLPRETSLGRSRVPPDPPSPHTIRINNSTVDLLNFRVAIAASTVTFRGFGRSKHVGVLPQLRLLRLNRISPPRVRTLPRHHRLQTSLPPKGNLTHTTRKLRQGRLLRERLRREKPRTYLISDPSIRRRSSMRRFRMTWRIFRW